MIIDHDTSLTIAGLHNFAFARGRAESQNFFLSKEVQFCQHIEDNHQFLENEAAKGAAIYGLTTGFGSSSANRLNLKQSVDLQKNLFRYHTCGLGEPFKPEQVKAILLIRLTCLAKGFSGVSLDLLRHMGWMLENEVLPLMPSLGSVGASGDLTPLAYLAGAMAGEGNVYHHNDIYEASEVYQNLKRKPYIFKPREALAIMNGTSVMTAIAALAWSDVEKIFHELCRMGGLLVELLDGHHEAYSFDLHKVKHHSGQAQVAELISSWLGQHPNRPIKTKAFGPIQDPYSLRCMPQLLGVLCDTLNWSRQWIENELNSVADNPIVDHQKGLILNGGHFFGGHVAMACDSLKIALASAINLMDRQMALLMDARSHERLSENLRRSEKLKDQVHLHHGFKAIQITMSAIATELIKNAGPISTQSRPTESSNQDVVSLGTIAARELQHMAHGAQDCVALLMSAIIQGFAILEDKKTPLHLSPRASESLARLSTVFKPLTEDRASDLDLIVLKKELFGHGIKHA